MGGAASRAKGINFERRIAAAFRAEGLDCRRVLEYDGFSHGADLELFVTLAPPRAECPRAVRFIVPVVIQCKCTKDPADLNRGLREALDGNPGKKLYVCIHSCRRLKTIKVAYYTDHRQVEEIISWPTLLQRIRALIPLSYPPQTDLPWDASWRSQPLPLQSSRPFNPLTPTDGSQKHSSKVEPSPS